MLPVRLPVQGHLDLAEARAAHAEGEVGRAWELVEAAAARPRTMSGPWPRPEGRRGDLAPGRDAATGRSSSTAAT